MKENVYIHSKDIFLIKQLIDYSSLSSTFTLSGISMADSIFVEELIQKNICLLLLDENEIQDELYVSLKILKQLNPSQMKVLYICEKMDSINISKLTNLFPAEVFIQNHNIFDLLFLIERMIEKNTEIKYEKRIQEQLRKLYIKESVHGFLYLKYAILLKIEDSQMKMNTMCDKIAREYHVTSSRVDRCMRTSIEYAYKQHPDIFHIYYHFDGKPSCMHFIAKLAEEIMYLS